VTTEGAPAPSGDVAPLLDVRAIDAGYGSLQIVSGVSLSVAAGEHVLVFGPNGAGKSTFVKAIAGIATVLGGAVRLDGVSLDEIDISKWRDMIGYVPQEVNLLSGTIRENIRFGRTWISDDDLDMAVDVARLREEIAGWPEGLDTVVGSRGLRLSGGQKQRVALARALAGRPAILLLDDCTASLDAETEEQVWRELSTAIPGCTIILVTHRPATLQRSNQIIVLDRGAIREQGTFEELRPSGTYFHELYVQWKLQDELGE